MDDLVLMTPSAAARVAEKSVSWIRYMVATQQLRCIRTTTGVKLFKREDVLELVRRRDEKSPEPPRAA
jgi:hypothetical protein